MNHEWHPFLCINYERDVCLKQNLSQNSMLITVCRWTRSGSWIVFEANAWRCIMQWIPTIFGLCFLASFKNPEREPSIAGAPSMQIPTTFSQLKPSVVKKSDTTIKTSRAVVLLVSPRQNKKSSKILPSHKYHELWNVTTSVYSSRCIEKLPDTLILSINWFCMARDKSSIRELILSHIEHNFFKSWQWRIPPLRNAEFPPRGEFPPGWEPLF